MYQGRTGWLTVKTTDTHQDQWQLVFKPSSSSCCSHVHSSQHDGCERHPQHLCLKSMRWIEGRFLFGVSRENSFGHNRTIETHVDGRHGDTRQEHLLLHSNWRLHVCQTAVIAIWLDHLPAWKSSASVCGCKSPAHNEQYNVYTWVAISLLDNCAIFL